MIQAILLLFFIAIPLLEIGIILLFSNFIAIWGLFISQIITAILGLIVLHSMDLYLPFQVETSLRKGEPVVWEMWEESMIIVAGIFLVIPGVFTDLLGMLLLTPAIRIKLMQLIPNKL